MSTVIALPVPTTERAPRALSAAFRRFDTLLRHERHARARAVDALVQARDALRLGDLPTTLQSLNEAVFWQAATGALTDRLNERRSQSAHWRK